MSDNGNTVELWKPIAGFPRYQISNLGNVRAMKFPNRYKKPLKYRAWQLYRDGKYHEVSYIQLMNSHWRYAWISQLADDEEATVVDGHYDYFVTSKGRVFTTKSWQWLTPRRNKDYYWCVTIDETVRNLHTLVGRNFLAEYTRGSNLQVAHHEETLPYPDINFVSNLWIATPSENTKDMIAKGRSRLKGHRR